jgi:hypothetical protein
MLELAPNEVEVRISLDWRPERVMEDALRGIWSEPAVGVVTLSLKLRVALERNLH